MIDKTDKNQLIQEAQVLLTQRPRKNDEIISVLSEIIEFDPNNWMGNIELSECHHQKGEWKKSLEYATRANQLRVDSARAQILMVRGYIALHQPENALGLMFNIFSSRKGTACQIESTNNTALITLFELLSTSPHEWSDKAQNITLFRDLLISFNASIGFEKSVQEKISGIEPTSALGVVEIVRFLQLKSIVADNSSCLLLWLNKHNETLSSEELFIAYQLTVKLGSFPERFKAFAEGQGEIANILLESAVNKVRAATPLPSRPLDSIPNNHRYLFFLAHMPTDDWFLRTGAHFKVIVDYARFLTEIDPESEVTVLISNELSEVATQTYFGRWPYVATPENYENIFLEHYPGYITNRIKFVSIQSDLADVNDKYFERSLELIKKLEPDVIVWFGGVLESVVFPNILAKQYPSVYRQFNVGNRPRGHFDIGMSYSEKTTELMGGHWVKFEVAYSDLPTTGKVPTSISELLMERTVLITAGNNLIMRVDANFIRCAINLLDKNSNVRWLLVGIKDVGEFRLRYPDLEPYIKQSRVILSGFVNYLGGLMDYTDIFVYPKQGGGLGGMALAAMRGIPVLCFQGGDADALLRKEDMASTYMDFQDRLDQLVNNIDCRKMQGERYKSVFGREKFISEAQRLIDVCGVALEIYRNRQQMESDSRRSESGK